MILDIYAVARGKEARAFRLACCLAIFNQATASTGVLLHAMLRQSAGMCAVPAF